MQNPTKQPGRAGVYLLFLFVSALALALVVTRGKEKPADTAGIHTKGNRHYASVKTMGTRGTILMVTPDVRTAGKWLPLAVEQIEYVNTAMSSYSTDSELSMLNATASKGPVPVSNQLLRVLVQSRELSRLSGGAFDVTYSPLRDLWRNAARNGLVPDQSALQACRKKIGWQKVALDEESAEVRFTSDGMKIDLGAIAKGYGIDLAAEALSAAGMRKGFIEIGGDMRVIGTSEQGRPWRVGVRDPREPAAAGAFIGKILLSDCAVATSGNYERYFEVDGKRYSHIMDPRTGMPVQSVLSATVIAPTAMLADGLATTITVLGPEKGIDLIESLPDVECLLVTKSNGDLIIQRSSAFAKYEDK